MFLLRAPGPQVNAPRGEGSEQTHSRSEMGAIETMTTNDNKRPCDRIAATEGRAVPRIAYVPFQHPCLAGLTGTTAKIRFEKRPHRRPSWLAKGKKTTRDPVLV